MYGDGAIVKVTDRVKHRCKSGNVTVHLRVSYRPRLEVTSHEFATRFATSWKGMTGRSVSVQSGVRSNFTSSTIPGMSLDRSVTLFRVTPRDHLFGRYLAHLKYECDPMILLKFPHDAMHGIVRGLIDSEGYIAPSYIDVANKNGRLLDALSQMLVRLGFASSIYCSPSQSVQHLRVKRSSRQDVTPLLSPTPRH